MRRRILRPLAWVLGIVSLSIFLLAGSIRLDQYLLRRRAEHLLSDVRSLELRKSSYSDARRIIDLWSSEVQQGGPCRQSWCVTEISLENIAWRYARFFSNHQRILELYRRIGGRAALVRASIRVRDNIVWGKSFSVYVDSTYVDDGEGGRFYYTLIGRFGSGSPTDVSYLHPEYAIGRPGGCTGCIEGHVVYTPFADAADIQRLSDVNLACLTQFHPCATQGDIIPSAWKELASEPNRGVIDGFPCTASMIRTLSREYRRVVVGVSDPGGIASSKDRVVLKLESELKPGDFQNSFHEYEIPGTFLHLSTRFILFFQIPQMTNAQNCLAPATPENLAMARQGVLEDWSDPPILADPLNRNISPPHVDVH
jgi:hypothetical protein